MEQTLPEQSSENIVIYECEACNYSTNIKRNYEKHINTKKHTKNINGDGDDVCICKLCNFQTNNKYSFGQHLKTKKHKTRFIEFTEEHKVVDKSVTDEPATDEPATKEPETKEPENDEPVTMPDLLESMNNMLHNMSRLMETSMMALQASVKIHNTIQENIDPEKEQSVLVSTMNLVATEMAKHMFRQHNITTEKHHETVVSMINTVKSEMTNGTDN
jgi:hypothetical protein